MQLERKGVHSNAMLQEIPSHAQVLAQLKATFGYESLRPLQDEVIQSVLRGKDAFVLMPTGGGKSLCYQLPALLLPGMTVVVSPLIALMKDQVDRLQSMGVAAAYINSSLERSEIGRRESDVARGAVKLLYVAPERLMTSGLLRLLASQKVSLFAIDEAHCISEWGHDFRPEYRELKRLREHFPAVPTAAFTATATKRVQEDIVAQLRLRGPNLFRGSLNRSNLFYTVWPKQGAYQRLVERLRAQGPVSGIVYAGSRAQTERLAEKLRADGLSAQAYHAGLESRERQARQDAFIDDDVRIMVATIAFGMGIDKPDIRFVVHYDLPKNLEGYYQETGRAGRDGEPSDCILFYSYGDVAKYEHFILEKASQAERRAAREQLGQMAAWAESADCRRRALLAYFGEELGEQPERCCDVCETPVAEADWTIPAQMLLSCARRTGETFGMAHLIRVLRGSRDERIVRLEHDKLPTHGIGRDRSQQEWHNIANGLLRAGFVRVAAERYNAVEVTESGREVLFRGRKVILRIAASDGPERVFATAVQHEDLFQELRALRRRLAQERNVAPFAVFHDMTLRQMAAELPDTPARLRHVRGVGERKLEELGDDFLAVVTAYVERTGARPVAGVAAPKRPQTDRSSRKDGLGPTASQTADMFRSGMSVEQIAVARGLALSTVEGHVAMAMEAGEDLDLDRLVGPEKRRVIEAALQRLGPGPLKPVMEELGEGYTYAEIRYVRAAMALTDA